MKYLDERGLTTFWKKIKEHLSGNYYTQKQVDSSFNTLSEDVDTRDKAVTTAVKEYTDGEVKTINAKFENYNTVVEVDEKDGEVYTRATSYTDDNIKKIMPLIYAGL